MVFKTGQKLSMVCGPMSVNGDQIFESVGKTCSDIEVIMENGQMAVVPWALVNYKSNRPSRKINLALMEFVDYQENQTHENNQTQDQQRTESPSN
jgi:hypothetical protein